MNNEQVVGFTANSHGIKVTITSRYEANEIKIVHTINWIDWEKLLKQIDVMKGAL